MSEFHIHINAQTIDRETETKLEALKFLRKDFIANNDPIIQHEPFVHLSLKMFCPREFKYIFNKTTKILQHSNNMTGYVEGEFLKQKCSILEKEYQENFSIPFQVKTYPQVVFRKSEIHVTLDDEASNSIVMSNLLKMGFFSLLLPKPNYLARVFTLQGNIKQIHLLYPYVVEYLNNIGGIKRCVVKEERTAKYWVSNGGVKLPPKINNVELFL